MRRTAPKQEQSSQGKPVASLGSTDVSRAALQIQNLRGYFGCTPLSVSVPVLRVQI